MQTILFSRNFHRLNLTNEVEPYFVVESLDKYSSLINFEDNILKAVIYAANQKGRSSGVVIKEFILETNAENRPGIY